jgi:hypothetical protein
MTKYFYLKTLQELNKQNLSIHEPPTYIGDMNTLAVKMKGKKFLLAKSSFNDFWIDGFINCNWNNKWLKEISTQLEFNFNA